MKTFWKIPLEPTDEQFVSIPVNSTILSAQIQNGVICLWAIVDLDHRNHLERKKIVIVGTGNPMPECASGCFLGFISTVQQFDGALVWHIFEEVKE